MAFDFEVFDRKSAGRTRTPWITIQTRGNFSINEAAARMIAGGGDAHGIEIELLYDPKSQAVGFRRAAGKGPNPYILRRQTNGSIYIAPGKAFTEHFGIDTSKARRYTARELGEGVVGFQLSDKSSIVERSSKAREVNRDS